MRGTNQTRRVLGAAAGVTTLLLTLSACTDEPDDTPTAPSFAPPTSTNAAEPSDPATDGASPDPTAGATTEAMTAPELPPAATEETPEGAAAFAEWWFDTLNYATATGDTEAFRSAFQDECESCQGFAGRIEDAYDPGGRIEGGLLSVQIDPPAALQDGIASMPVYAEAEAGSVMDENGETETVLNAEQVNLVIALAWDGSSWRVGDLVA